MTPRFPTLHRFSLRCLRVALALAVAGITLACVGTSIDEVRELQDSGAYRESIVPLQRILSVAPAHAEANYRLALALLRTGEPSTALWYLRKAADSDEYGTPAGLILASRFYAEGELDEAIAAADRILERNPDNPAALLSRARAALSAGRMDAALESADHLLRLQPQHGAAHSIRADALAASGRWEEANAAFQSAYALAREQESPLAGRSCVAGAGAFARQGDPDRAALEIRVCVEAHPDPRSIAWAAQAYDRIGRHDAALNLLRDLVHDHPELPGPANALARRLAQQGQELDFALRLAQRAGRLAPGPETADTLGWVHLRRDELTPAEAAFRSALEQNANYATARYHLGLVLARRGEQAQALEALHAAVAVGRFADEDDARREIARLERR